MKRNRIKSSLFIGAATLLFCFPNFRGGGLKEITKPYLGVYECKQVTLGEEDFLQRFDEITLELKSDGEFILYYRECGGQRRRETGKYQYDVKDKTVTFSANKAGTIKKAFLLENGVLTGTARLGNKTVTVKFMQK